MADSTDYTKWMDRAGQDLRLIEVIYKEDLEGLEDSFCYMCQQAAEKLLKAFVVKNEKSVPRSHDLLYLLGICKKHDPTVLALTDALTVLNEYSVSARYPSDFEDKRTVEEAEEAYNFIIEVKNVISGYLSK